MITKDEPIAYVIHMSMQSPEQSLIKFNKSELSVPPESEELDAPAIQTELLDTW